LTLSTRKRDSEHSLVAQLFVEIEALKQGKTLLTTSAKDISQMSLDWSQGDSSAADQSPATMKCKWRVTEAWLYGAISQSDSRSLERVYVAGKSDSPGVTY
jgi:hypothetical protein